MGICGLHQRIRSQGRALAKMDIRAPRVLIKASVTSTAFRTRIPSRRFDRYAICFSPTQTVSAAQFGPRSCRSGQYLLIEALFMTQHSPDDPGQLSGECHHHDIGMGPAQQLL